MTQQRMRAVRDYLLILAGSILYAASTLLFIFPHRILLGGTSGISVILEAFLPFSPGMILTGINISLIIWAFILLGRDMVVRTLVGSVITTLAVGLLSSLTVFASSAIGLLIRAFGIDFVIGRIKKFSKTQ